MEIPQHAERGVAESWEALRNWAMPPERARGVPMALVRGALDRIARTEEARVKRNVSEHAANGGSKERR